MIFSKFEIGNFFIGLLWGRDFGEVVLEHVDPIAPEEDELVCYFVLAAVTLRGRLLSLFTGAVAEGRIS